MNKLILITIAMIIFSCQHTDKIDKLLKNNNALIENEFYDIEKIVLINPAKAMPYYKLSKKIFKKYKIIYDSFFNDSLNNALTQDLLSEIYKTELFHIDNYETIDLYEFKDNSIIINYLQTQTLYCLKALKEHISNTDYATNICRIEPIKIGNKIKLIVSKLDTTQIQGIMIGKLQNTKKTFIDTFQMAEIIDGYGYISNDKLGRDDFIEGLCIVPMINGNLDTIRFKSKIIK